MAAWRTITQAVRFCQAGLAGQSVGVHFNCLGDLGRDTIILSRSRADKCSMNQDYFLTRRLCNVRTEMSLTMLAYNIKRVIRLKGTQELMAALPT